MSHRTDRFACLLIAALVVVVGAGAVAANATTVTFSHEAVQAGGVYLAGEFNGWSDSANPMVNADGIWSLAMELDPGTYQYKFVVDGSWIADPNNPNTAEDGFGGSNSVLTVPDGVDKLDAGAAVAGGAAVATAAPAAPAAGGGQVAVTFHHSAPGASSVYAAGEFNGWSDTANPMSDNDGEWTLVLNLDPGDY